MNRYEFIVNNVAISVHKAFGTNYNNIVIVLSIQDSDIDLEKLIYDNLDQVYVGIASFLSSNGPRRTPDQFNEYELNVVQQFTGFFELETDFDTSYFPSLHENPW